MKNVDLQMSLKSIKKYNSSSFVLSPLTCMQLGVTLRTKVRGERERSKVNQESCLHPEQAVGAGQMEVISLAMPSVQHRPHIAM